MNGDKIQDKNNVGLFGNWERGKKEKTSPCCSAQAWRQLLLPFTGGLDGSWWSFHGNFLPFTAHPPSSVSKSSFLPQNVPFFAPKRISHRLLHDVWVSLGSLPRCAAGAPGKPPSSSFWRIFNAVGLFLGGLRGHLVPADPGSSVWPALPLQARSSCSFFSNESSSAAPSSPAKALWDV